MVKTIDHFMDAAAARAGEEIVAAQWFYPQDRWKNPMHVADEHASWPRSGITGTQKRVELSGSGNTGPLHSQTFLRLLLQTPDGPLGVDLPTGDRHSQEVARALVR